MASMSLNSVLLFIAMFGLACVTLWEAHEHHRVSSELTKHHGGHNRLRVEDLVIEEALEVHTRHRSSQNSVYSALNAVEEQVEQVTMGKATADLATLDPACHTIEHLELDGTAVVKWGADHKKESAGECCDACQIDPDCNVWVWCGQPQGCGSSKSYKECWLKKSNLKSILAAKSYANPTVAWMSGAIFDEGEKDRLEGDEERRLQALRSDPSLPLVYFDISIKGKHIGRVTMVMFKKEAPLAVENFRQLCTGEHGIVPEGREGAGRPYHLKGAAFYRIIDNFIIQTGANTESVYGGQFKDDPAGLTIKHDRPGLLSMANVGPNTSTSHFSILLAPAPHLDGHYVVFGEVVDGMEVVRKVNALSKGKPNGTVGPEEQAVITDSGQLREGS